MMEIPCCQSYDQVRMYYIYLIYDIFVGDLQVCVIVLQMEFFFLKIHAGKGAHGHAACGQIFLFVFCG